jgi:uncharacterized RDD family membrane protein YckC
MPERPLVPRPEPKPERRRAPLPARLFGRGARGAGQIAEAAGIDRAIEQATEDAIVRAVESEAMERALGRVLDGPVVDRAVKRALESEAVDQAWERLLASDEAQRLIERIAEAPEIRAAIASQSAGLLEDIARQVRGVARRLDDALERVVRRILFRKQRSEPTDRAGFVSRGLALGIDVAVINIGFFAASALLALAASVFLADPSGVSAPALAVGAAYLLLFWSLAGQTPGMRFLSVVITADGRHEIGFRRAARRLAGSVLAAIPLGLGFIGILLGDRRRGLQDVIAGTEVVYAEPHTHRGD